MLTFDKVLKFALDKYTDRSRIDNHVWWSSSKREAEFVALAAEATTLKGNLRLAEKIAKEKKTRRGRGGVAPNTRTGAAEKATRLALWQRECIKMKKVPPTPGGP